MHLGAESVVDLVIDRRQEVVVLRNGLDLLIDEGNHSEERHRAYQGFLDRVYDEACVRKPYPFQPDPATHYQSPVEAPNLDVGASEVVLVKEAADAVIASRGVLGFIYKMSGAKRHARQMSTTLGLIPSESI